MVIENLTGKIIRFKNSIGETVTIYRSTRDYKIDLSDAKVVARLVRMKSEREITFQDSDLVQKVATKKEKKEHSAQKIPNVWGK